MSNAPAGAISAPRTGVVEALREYGRLARLEGGGFAVVAIFGAFAAAANLVTTAQVAWLFTVNLLFLTGGCIHNDVADAAADRLSGKLKDRPLARGTVRRSHAAAVAAACLAGCLATATVLTTDPVALGCLAGGIACVLLYNVTSRRLMGADLFFSAAAALLCAFGGLSVMPPAQPEVLPSGRLWLVCGIVFADHLFFNAIEGGLKDFGDDRRAGAPTAAHYLYRALTGWRRRVLQWALFGVKLGSVLAVATPFLLWQHPVRAWQAAALAVAGIGTLLFSWQLLAQNPPEKDRSLRLTKLQEMCCRGLVPLMLVSAIGSAWPLALIVVPFLWYFLFNYLLHGQVCDNVKTT